MNHTDDTRRDAGGAAPADELAGAPFRHLSTGRRRREATAPLDHIPAPGITDTHVPAEPGADVSVDVPAPEGSEPAPLPAASASEEATPISAHSPDAVEELDSEEAIRASAAAVAGAHAARNAQSLRTFEEVVIPQRDEKLEAALAARKRRRRRRNAVMATVFAAFVVLLTVGALFLNSLFNVEPEDFEGPGQGEVNFVVESGWGANRVAAALVEEGVVASSEAFLEALAESDAPSKEIHAGEFQLQKGLPAAEAVELLIGNKTPVHYVAIKPNTRLTAALEEISKGTGVPLEELTELSTQPATFGLEETYPNLEGFIHPGEYRFPVETTAQEMLQEMVDGTLARLEELGVTDPEQQYRALTIASIVQGESRQGDYAAVAGAIENRLDPGNTETAGFLQVDSAVIYGLNRYTLEFTAEEKADASNPYNTYKHQGLPPTPIGSPGNSALEAAVNPQENDYYYWVTVNIETGETKFATTYAEHQQNQQEYRDYCAANPEVCGH